MTYDFDQITNRIGTNAGKWEAMYIVSGNADKNTLPFWVADMDFACPAPIITAIKDRADESIFGYSLQDEDYYSAVTNWMKKRFKWDIQKEDIFLSSGIVPAIKALLLSLTEKGESVIIQNPVYHPFSEVVLKTERILLNNSLINTDGYYTMDLEDLEEKASRAETKMMIFCSPHNPVGRVWSKEELYEVARICTENNVILISDEIHADLVMSGHTHYPTALVSSSDMIITCTAPSKTFNIAGLHMSNIIIKNEAFKEKWLNEVGLVLPSPLSIPAVKAAYNECDEWVDELNMYLESNYDYMVEFFNTNMPLVNFKKPEGTYLAWVDFSKYGLSDERIDDIMINEANVILYNGIKFGPEGSGYQRINIACPRSTLKKGLERICEAFDSEMGKAI